jgi:soluble lytic murein transglycosylase-like protein
VSYPGKHLLALILLALPASWAWAGAQREEALAASVRAVLHAAVADQKAPEPIFPSLEEKLRWLNEMAPRLAKRIPDTKERVEFLKTVFYESQRAGLDPQMVLGLIQVESGFHKYAVSSVGARGLMQVMPFWTRSIGTPDQNLFHLRTNLRYGCTILRHYLDMEKGDIYRALGRYNGSLGQADYPNAVHAAWQTNWSFMPADPPSPISQRRATDKPSSFIH